MWELHDRSAAMRLWAVSLTIVLASIGATSLSSASPSKQDVADAKQRLDSLNGELSVVVEEFNLARIRLVQAEQHLEETREEATRARARADDALAELNDRAGRVYQGFQSQWSTLLEASSLADFSDRIEFMGQLPRRMPTWQPLPRMSRERRCGWQMNSRRPLRNGDRSLKTSSASRPRSEASSTRLKRRTNSSAGSTAMPSPPSVRRRLPLRRLRRVQISRPGSRPPPCRSSAGALTPSSPPRDRSSGSRTSSERPTPPSGSIAPASRCGLGHTPGSRFHTRRPCSTPHSPQLTARLCSPAISSSRATVASARESSITSLSTSAWVRPSRPAVRARRSGTGPSIGTRSSEPPDPDSERRLINAIALG